MNRTYAASLILFALLFVLPFAIGENVFGVLQETVGESGTWGMALYGALLAAAVVVPFFQFPLFLIAGALWTPPTAAILGVVGWSIGACIVFFLARAAREPLLRKIVSQERVREYERRISHIEGFWILVFLRMITPVDLLSYALALGTRISFSRYLVATVIGVTPFAVLFSYGGRAFAEGSHGAFAAIAGIAIAAFTIGFALVKKEKERV